MASPIPGTISLQQKRRSLSCHFRPADSKYLERKTVKVAQDFSFTFDKVHYSMPRKYLRQELEIRAGEKEIYVYNKHGDLIRTHKRSYTPKDWVIIPSDMPAEYKDYGYWTVPYFQQKASAIGPSTRGFDRCSHSEICLSGTVIPKLLWYFAICGKVLTGSSRTLL